MNHDVAVDESCIAAFRDLRGKREVNAVVYLVTEGTDSDVLAVGEKGNLTYEELLRALPADKPRLALYDLPFATPDGTRHHRIVSICWIPAATDDGVKSAYRHAQTALAEAVDAEQMTVVATTPSELEYHHLTSRAQ
ncbi:hypothetical protein ACGFXC_36180 [Streptomyces sp. NPDC048507]|uniref:hypothetical protein n=1 Tax=Streptomyces sp. NPDC048507 TaxID=3365560 RepID=UPI00371661FC